MGSWGICTRLVPCEWGPCQAKRRPFFLSPLNFPLKLAPRLINIPVHRGFLDVRDEALEGFGRVADVRRPNIICPPYLLADHSVSRRRLCFQVSNQSSFRVAVRKSEISCLKLKPARTDGSLMNRAPARVLPSLFFSFFYGQAKERMILQLKGGPSPIGTPLDNRTRSFCVCSVWIPRL